MCSHHFLKNISLPLRVKAAAVPATDAAIQNIYIYIYICFEYIYIYGLDMTTLIISNEEMKDMMEIVKSLEQSGLLEKGVSETNENEEKINKKVDFLICY